VINKIKDTNNDAGYKDIWGRSYKLYKVRGLLTSAGVKTGWNSEL